MRNASLSTAWLCSLFCWATAARAAGEFPLVQAVQNQDKEAVRALLRQHVDVSAHAPGGASALSWAAHWNNSEIADLLIAAGADANSTNIFGDMPLWEACNNGSPALVEKLLKIKANVNVPSLRTGETAIMRCARTGNLKAVQALLAAGADVNVAEKERGQTALMWAIEEGHRDVAKALIEHGAAVDVKSKGGFTPFLFAARQGDIDSARLMLAKGADINQPAPGGMNALLLATDSGREAFAIFLVENGASASAADADKLTVLHYAMRRGLSTLRGVTDTFLLPDQDYLFRPNMIELMKVLLDHGADPNVRIGRSLRRLDVNDRPMLGLAGATPFFLAAATVDIPVMKLLLSKGANPNIATLDNTTPLMVAAGIGRWRGDARYKDEAKNALDTVKLLVELGADVNAASDDVGSNIPGAGETAMHGAALAGANDIIEFLASKGARLDEPDYFGMTPLSIAEGDRNGLVPDFSEAQKHEDTASLIRSLLGRPAPLESGPPVAAK